MGNTAISYATKAWPVVLGCSDRFGPSNPFWRGGRTITEHGYVLVKFLGHPCADVRGYVYEHRLVAAKKIGRPLSHKESVHHIDGNKQNNDPANLDVVTRKQHAFLHRRTGERLQSPDEDNFSVECECGCGTGFLKYDSSGRPRRFVSGHNKRRSTSGAYGD